MRVESVVCMATWSMKGITLQYEKEDRTFHFCFGDWTNNQKLPLHHKHRVALLFVTAS